MKILLKKLQLNLKKLNGRNGRILCFTKKGFKLKLSYRFIDFYLNFFYNNILIYLKYIHDTFRNAKLFLCLSVFGFYFYILGIEKIKCPVYFNLLFAPVRKVGLALKLKDCSDGDFISNFSFYKDYYGQISRSAGKYAQVLKTIFFVDFSLIRLGTGKKFYISNTNNCMLGVICNSFFYNLIKGKAGFNSNYGFKSIVRGVAMNPIDHPNGGRTPGGKVYCSYSFKIAKSRKKTSGKNETVKYIF